MAVNLTSTFLQSRPSPSTIRRLLPVKVRTAAAAAKVSRRHQVVGPQMMIISCRKKDIHPEFYEDAKVYCNGEQVLTTGGTQKEYVVDVWSGNHPFYMGNRSGMIVIADQVEKFRKKYAGLDRLMEIPTLKGEIVLPTKRKSAKGKKK